MRKCTLMLAALAQAQAQADPQIMTADGTVVIQANDVQFITDNTSTTINDLLRDLNANFSGVTTTIAEEVTPKISQLNTTLGNRIQAAIGQLEAAEVRLGAVEAKPVTLQVITDRTNLATACGAADQGKTFLLTEGAAGTPMCYSVFACVSSVPVLVSYEGAATGAAPCNPAANCMAAIASGSGATGRYYVGNRAVNRIAVCDASGVEIGDGSAANPGLSCESIYTHHPGQKTAVADRMFKVLSPPGHGQFEGFPARLGVRGNGVASENQYVTCRGVRNATHAHALKYGSGSGTTARYSYYILPANQQATVQRVRCTNSLFGDPYPGRGKYCHCGLYVRAAVDIKCQPAMDARVTAVQTGLQGWWRAEDYKLSMQETTWKSLNPQALFGSSHPAITDRVATIVNPAGWSRDPRSVTGDNNAGPRYNGLAGYSDASRPLVIGRSPGLFPQPASTGGTGVDFGVLTQYYTICTTSRYFSSNGGRARIFVANTGNWLHGHWGSRTNVVHYGSWVTWVSRGNRYDWIVTCTTSGAGNNDRLKSYYIYNGVKHSTLSNYYRNLRSGANKRFGIGIGDYQRREQSHYAFGEVMIWNNAKTQPQLQNLARYMTDRLKAITA